MNIFKKNEKNTGNRLPTPDKVKKGFRYYCSLVAATPSPLSTTCPRSSSA